MVRVTYETIKETFEKEGCQLLTTKCEMVKNNMNTNSNYIIIAECGHQINNCNYHAFNSKLRGRKKLCSECINKKLSDNYKKLLEFYNTISTDTIENIQTPITNCCKKEQLYRKFRENNLTDIKFEYPEVNQCVYDFKINNYKVQEKTAFIRKPRKYYKTNINRNKNGNKCIPYDSGDNDFYWINLQDNQTFYIIPENIFIEKQIISSGNILDESSSIKGKTDLSFAKKNIWLNEYKYSYNEENINEIISHLFKILK